MKVGLVVPQFVESPDVTLRFGRAAETAGMNGVFVFDHLWAFPDTSGPALPAVPMAAALVAHTDRMTVGTLVARVGIVPDDVLEAQLTDLAEVAAGRFVAGLGVGDSYSVAENEAYGVDTGSRQERLDRLEGMCRRLLAAGVETWAGGRSLALQQVAARAGAAVNLWGVTAAEVVEADQQVPRVTWGGRVESPKEAAEMRLALEATAAEWAVFLVKGSRSEPEETVEAFAAAVL